LPPGLLLIHADIPKGLAKASGLQSWWRDGAVWLWSKWWRQR